MPRATKVETVEEDVESENGKRSYVPRLSITVTSEMMHNIRIAAALADMEKGEWCTKTLERAADKAVNGSE